MLNLTPDSFPTFSPYLSLPLPSSDTLFQPVVRMSDAHFYTSYRMASMIGAAVEGICLSSGTVSLCCVCCTVLYTTVFYSTSITLYSTTLYLSFVLDAFDIFSIPFYLPSMSTYHSSSLLHPPPFFSLLPSSPFSLLLPLPFFSLFPSSPFSSIFLLSPIPCHTVFDVVYPGLADLLARAGGIPQLSLILSTQMARLAIASLSYHTPPPGHTGPTGHTGHTGFGQRYGQGGAGNGYWELVVECLCSSYSRTVSRMKDLPVEQELVKSATSVRLILCCHILFSSYIPHTHSLCLLYTLSLSYKHTHTHTHTQML